MKPLVIAGIALAALGVFILLKGLSYSSQENVLSVGDVHVSAREQHLIPTWAGAVAIAGGLVLVGAGMRKQRGA